MLLAAGLAMTAAISEAAPKKDFRRKPVAPDITLKVLRGRSEVIRLPGVESNGNPIRYEIVSRPSAGKLSNLEQPDPNRQGPGFVTYTHGDDEVSTIDEFKYRVSAPISGLRSSSGTVTVHIVDLPPRLGAERSVVFSAIVGETTTTMLSLTNIGGGTLRGTVRVRPPFHVAEDASFELGRGRSTRIPVHYAPVETGLSAPEKIQPARDDPGASITLRGEASAPFAVKTSADKLELKADDSRATVVEVVNLSANPQEVEVSVEPATSVETIPAVALGPRETRAISLRIPAERKGAAEDFTVTFSTRAHALSRGFSAPAVPARLEVLTPVVDFGRSREAALVVRNSGGVDGRFSVVLPPGLTCIDRAASFSVAQGRETSVRLRLATSGDESAPTELLVTTSAGASERVAIRTTPAETVDATPEEPAKPVLAPPAPPPLPGALNDNVRLIREENRWRLEWNLPEDWSEARVEKIGTGSGAWRQHQAPHEEAGWFAWLTAIPTRFIGFFSRLTSPKDLETISPDATTAGKPGTKTPQGIAVSDNDVKSGTKWRLLAKAGGSADLVPVTEEFVIDAGTGKLHAIKPPPIPETSPAPGTGGPPQADTGPKPGIITASEPVTKLEAVQQEIQRKSSTLLLAIPYDPAIESYRLERMSMVCTINPATGLPSRPDFQVMPHEGKITFLSQGKTQQGGKDLSVAVAKIDGLQPGTSTTWRLVPVANGKDLPPTGEFVVRTLPPWRISWSNVFFWSAIVMLAGILYLRWKTNRMPS